MFHQLLLFADADNWIKLAIFLVIGTVSVIKWLSDHLRQRQIEKMRQPRPAAADRADPIANEIEEFLKKHARREETRPQPAPPTRPASGAASATSAAAGARSEKNNRGRRKPNEPRDSRRPRQGPVLVPSVDVQTLDDTTRSPPREAVGDRVRQSFDNRKFAERAAQLGSLDTAPTIEQHLKDSFSHQVGTLASGTTNLAAANRAATAGAAATGTRKSLPIAALLAGGNLRNAVIINEVLNRPVDRW